MAAISCLAGPGVPLRGLMPSGPVRPVRPCLVRPLGLCPAPGLWQLILFGPWARSGLA